jgi:hypothetical protein
MPTYQEALKLLNDAYSAGENRQVFNLSEAARALSADRVEAVSDAAVKRAVDVFANQPSGSYDDGAEERLMRAVLEDFAAQPQPGRVEGVGHD